MPPRSTPTLRAMITYRIITQVELIQLTLAALKMKFSEYKVMMITMMRKRSIVMMITTLPKVKMISMNVICMDFQNVVDLSKLKPRQVPEKS